MSKKPVKQIAKVVRGRMSEGGTDPNRINVNERWEVKVWCEKFGCTDDELRAAVEKVGIMANNVEEELLGQ